MSKASESIRRWLEGGAYGERINDTGQLLQERDELLSALEVFVNKYNSAQDGELGIGLTNADFLYAREVVAKTQGETKTLTRLNNIPEFIELAKTVANLNPNFPEIGEGMLVNIVTLALTALNKAGIEA